MIGLKSTEWQEPGQQPKKQNYMQEALSLSADWLAAWRAVKPFFFAHILMMEDLNPALERL